MGGAIVEYVRRSGLVPQSIEAALPELPRWAKRMRERGIDAAPRYPGQGPARAENELNLLFGRGRGSVTRPSSTSCATSPGFGRQSPKPPAVGTPYRVSINCGRTR